MFQISIFFVALTMSFGFSIADIIAVGKLARNVYQACRAYPEVFQEISREASATHAVLKRLENELQDKQSIINRCDTAKTQELMGLIGGLRIVLEDLDTIIFRHKQGRRIQNAYRISRADLNGLRSKLNHHFTAINAFTNSLTRDSLARIETVLLRAVQEVREGRRADPLRNASAKKQLGIDLARNGVSTRDIIRYGPAITTFLLGCKVGNFCPLSDLARRRQKTIQDGRTFRDEETSSEEETTEDDSSSSEGESFKSFSGESSRDIKSFSNESMSGEDTSSDEVSSSDEESPIAKMVLKKVVTTGVKYAIKALLQDRFG